MSKQYGLILPNKSQKKPLNSITKPSIFNDDSDSDSIPTCSLPTGQRKLRKQDKIDQNKALEEDPTVYQYDEIYDEMEQKKTATKLARKDLDRRPKYINKLLLAAERRKRENERKIERQVQKEREAEGDEFKDKESFITPSYKKKLEEFKALEEQEKRDNYLEAIGDVTRQGNLDGFYRHLYDQEVNYDDRIDEELRQDDLIKVENNEQSNKRKLSEVSDDTISASKIKKTTDYNRKYRSRKESADNQESSDEPEEIVDKKGHLQYNLDADSDFEIDSSSEEEETNNKDKKDKSKDSVDKSIESEGKKLELPSKGNVLSDNAAMAAKKDSDSNVKQEINNEIKVKEESVPEIPKKPKIDIWKKRTVGKVFDEALQRYFERKSLKDSIKNNRVL